MFTSYRSSVEADPFSLVAAVFAKRLTCARGLTPHTEESVKAAEMGL